MSRAKVVIEPTLVATAEAYLAARRRYFETDADDPTFRATDEARMDAARNLADDAVRLILGAPIANAAALADQQACAESSERLSARFKARHAARDAIAGVAS